jgi:hypothetical protein
MFDKLRREWHLRDIGKRVRKHGWTAMYVGRYETSPCWAYSIGFEETLGQPEVAVFDISQSDANDLLWWIYASIEKGELIPRDGEVWSPEGEVVGTWRAVHPSQFDCDDAWFAAGLAIRERAGANQPYRAFQLVARDGEGNFPWDPAYDERLRHRQPALYLPLNEEASRLAAEAAV